MAERYVRPPLIATEPRTARARWRPAVWALFVLLAALAVALAAVLLAARLRAGPDDPGLPAGPHTAPAHPTQGPGGHPAPTTRR